MAQGWNPYLQDFSSLPSSHGTPDSEVTHPQQTEDFIAHGGLSSASISHGASAEPSDYCYSNSSGNDHSNWSSEVRNSQKNYREMAWQTDGEQKGYLPRCENSVSNFESNVLETAEHCSVAPQFGLKQDSTVSKDSQYFENYLNTQGSSDEVSDARSSCEFIACTSEHNPQTGATARYPSQWLQRQTENSIASSDRTYSNTCPNQTTENAIKCVQDRSKSFEPDKISFANSNTYDTNSQSQRTKTSDQTSKQTFVNLCPDAKLSQKYNGVDAQPVMDAEDTSATNKGKGVDSARKTFIKNPATNTSNPRKVRLLSDSCQNDKDDKDDGPSQSSTKFIVSNDLINSDVILFDASKTSYDSQSSFQTKSVSACNEKVVETDFSSSSQPRPTASGASHSDSCICPESHMDSVTEPVNEGQTAPSKVLVSSFSTSSRSEPSTLKSGDMKHEHDTLIGSDAACSGGCDTSTVVKNNESNSVDLVDNVTEIIGNKTNESNTVDLAANVMVDKINDKVPHLLKTPKQTSNLNEIKKESPENGPIPSDTTQNMKQIGKVLQNISCPEISEGQSLSCEITKANPFDEEHMVWKYIGKTFNPAPSEIDKRPETPKMTPSTEMLKRLQPIVLIRTSDLLHLISDKYICGQCMHITSCVDDLIKHHNLQHPMCNFQLCKSCDVYFVNQNQLKKHMCNQVSTILSSKLGKRKKRPKRFCNKCGIHFSRWNAFISHMRIHTGVTPYKCKECDQYFAQQSTLNRHKKIPGRCRGSLPIRKFPPHKSHNLSVKSMFNCYVKLYDITKAHFCKFCGKCFQSQSKVNKHINVHKKQVSIPKQTKVTSEMPEEAWSEKKKYKCPLCPNTFNHYLNRNRHLKDCLRACVFGRRNQVGGRYKCPLCLATFSFTSNRYRHVYTSCLRNFLSFLGKDTSMPIKFPRYSKGMKTVINKLKAEEEKLNGHSTTNRTYTTHELKLKCDVCSAVFPNKAAKYNHLKKHKKFKLTRHRFKANDSVNKTDIASSPATDTETQKIDIDSLKCKYCEKLFDSSQALKKHEFTHQGEQPFYCLQCGKGFKSHIVLTHHKITHHRRIQCTVCRKILPTIGALIQHRKTHLNRGLLQCPDCPRQFTFPVYLVRHVRYHLKTQNKLLQQDEKVTDSTSVTRHTHNQCPLCSEVFDDAKLLRKHYLSHIPKTSSPQCPFCKRKFTSRRYLVRHIARHLGNKRLSADINYKSHSETSSSKTETKASFVCRHCSRVFIHKFHLVKHYRGHKNNSLSQCPTCNLYFAVSKLSIHLKMCKIVATGSASQTTNQPSVYEVSSEGKKYRCQHCPQTFKYPSLYYRHLSKHKDIEVHPCILCGQNFPSLALCSQHEVSCDGLYKCEASTISKKAEIVSQSNPSDLKCKFCHKIFTKSRSLRRHILTHNEVKPYRCKACDSCFSRYDHLKIHLGCCNGKQKQQLRPQICIPKISLDQIGTGWKKEFRHGKIKKQTLECKICVKKFATQSKLNWHNSMFHTVKRLKCMQCSSFFTHEKSLRDHIRHRRCRLVKIVKSKRLLQQTQTTNKFSSEKQNIFLPRILPTASEQNTKKTKCNFCLCTFRTSAHLKVHMLLHCEKSFACDCGKSFFKKPNLLRHITVCDRKSNQSSPHGFSCAYCSSRFLLFSQLQEHFLNAHKLETMDEPIETSPLQQHLSNIQNFEENQRDVSEPSQSELNRPFEGKNSPMTLQLRSCPYPCKICSRGFWNKTLLRNHYRKCRRNVSNAGSPLQEEVPLRADIDMVLTDSGAEDSPDEEIEDAQPENKASQENKPTVYQCSECDKSFTDGLLLISHLEAHGREEQEKRLNKCSKCGRTFLNQARLEKHMKLHEPGQFICKGCSAEFSSNAELEIHGKQFHDPLNPYCCRICHYRFRTRMSLSDHSTKNHPNDIFSCHSCKRHYTIRTSLMRHNKKYHRHEQKGAEKSLGFQSAAAADAAAADAAAAAAAAADAAAADAAAADAAAADAAAAAAAAAVTAAAAAAAAGAAAACEDVDDGDCDDEEGDGGGGGGDGDDDDDHDDDDDDDDDYDTGDSGSNSDIDSADSDSAPYFPCHVCGKTFTTSESLEDHQKCHLGEKPYECAQCGQCFFQASQLQQHERKHKSEFQCQVCGRGFLTLFALRKHKHTSGKKRPFRCTKCPLYFTSSAVLADHMLSHREESFPCDICNRVFPSKISRAEHRKIHLPKSSDTGLSGQPADKAENKVESLSIRATNEFKYRCGVCCVRFRNPEELSEHGCLADVERPYSCLDCDKHFLHSTHLKKHLNIHKQPSSQSKYPCNQCKNSFSSSQDFMNHLRNHDETVCHGQDFVCPICHQCFTRSAELVFHFQNHTGGTFRCNICNKTFPTTTQLKEHEVCHCRETKCKKCGQSIQEPNHNCSPRHIELMNIVSSFADEIDVTGEDLCFCPFCTMRFSSRSNLLEHQNQEHPNEKSFTCEICARTYAKQKYLSRHMKKYHRKDTDQSSSQIKFQCVQCHSEFQTVKDLSVHLKLHAAEMEVGEYRCDMCYKSFDQLHLLRRHQESHVGQVVYECTECDKAFAFPHLLEEHQKSHL